MKHDEVIKGLDKAYKEAGYNAYFHNGFMAGVEFMGDRESEDSGTKITLETMLNTTDIRLETYNEIKNILRVVSETNPKHKYKHMGKCMLCHANLDEKEPHHPLCVYLRATKLIKEMP